MRRFVIIGGGFSGAACALHFFREHPAAEAEIVVVEPRPTLGAGLAYATPAREHRVNVAASRMSVVPEEPMHFHDWVRAQGTIAEDPASEMPDGRLYPSRAVFGRYVDAVLREAASGHTQSRLVHVRALASGVAASGGRFAVSLNEGEVLLADAVVLAVSHTKPDVPAALRRLRTTMDEHGRRGLLADPWDLQALHAIPAASRVLIVGSGLTACDVVATLATQNHAGKVTMVSRNGLMPRPRTDKPVIAEGDFRTAPERKALGLLRRVRSAMAAAMAEGRPWENIIDALRQQSVPAWGALDWAQRRKMLRHLRTFWDVHRFQSAPQIDKVVDDRHRSGQLSVLAARILSAEEDESGVRVVVRRRGASAVVVLEADVVVNCTGPGHRSVVQTHAVLRGLAETGGVQADPAQLGIFVDEESRVLRADGSAWPNLFVAGPLARGTFGELMGLPQVNLQPRAVAASLAHLPAVA